MMKSKWKGLYIEDDISLAQTVIASLLEKGVKVVWTRSVEDSLSELSKNRFSFFIIDLGLTDGEGFEVAKAIQEKGLRAPVLFLTARSGAEDRLKGYELGASEFIPKPFLFAELWMRLEHVLNEHASQSVVIDCHEFAIDTESYLLKWENGLRVHLTEKEVGVLVLLHESSPRVVRRSDLLDRVWGKESYPSERTVDNVVVKLRAHLKEFGVCIKSVRGVGYQWSKD